MTNWYIFHIDTDFCIKRGGIILRHFFAQNLANKLNVPVKAPTDYLWANPDGTYFVAGGKTFNGRLIPDRNKPGKFKTFYPQRRKKK